MGISGPDGPLREAMPRNRLRDAYITRLGGYLGRGLLDHALPFLRAARSSPNLLPADGRDAHPASPALEHAVAVPQALFGDRAADPERPRLWWERPGFGLMYQVEARPDWQWQRNFDAFNFELRGDEGELCFDGPYPRVPEWVEFSRQVNADYHLLQAKWHDGICWWDTRYTDWKTPTDYCLEFAEESRRSGIPFGFYYSAVFDHNPDFDAIQPLRRSTPSFLAMRGDARAQLRHALGFTQVARLLFWWMRRRLARQGIEVVPPKPWFDRFSLREFEPNPARYVGYLLDQLEELCEGYRPDALWIDWYDDAGAAASEEIMEAMREHHPDVALAFNQSLHYDLPWAHYLSGEAHGVRDAWRQVRRLRNMCRSWELVAPAAANWDAPQPRANPVENAVIAAIVMAAGGKVNFGVASEMDGTLRPDVMKQLETLGDWYRARRSLFWDAEPARGDGELPAGLSLDRKSHRALHTRQGRDALLHIFDLDARGDAPSEPLVVELADAQWPHIERAVLEPSQETVWVDLRPDGVRFEIPPALQDPVDTIVRIEFE